MNISIIRLLAWRYFTSNSSSTIKTMIGVCCSSIFVGAFALALIASIMRGFEYETHKKLQSIYPSISVKAPENSSLAYEPLTAFLEQKLEPYLKGMSPYLTKQALVHAATTDEPTYVITVKGVVPGSETAVTPLEKMTTPSTAFADLESNQVILGKELAEKLNVSVNEHVVLIFNQQEDTNFKDAQLMELPLVVTGIITTGIAEYDEHLALLNLNLCKKIWGTECVTHLGLSLKDPGFERPVLKALEAVKDIEFYSWKKLYPALVSSLDLEQYVMFFLLLLITLVASMNIVSLLFMYITYKRVDIALLKMLGMKNWQINLIFLVLSLIIAVLATSAGLAAAYGVGKLLQFYPCIKLPTDVYYVTHLPIKIEKKIFLLVFISVMILSISAALLPIGAIKKLNITKTLRFE